ncbi:hypothetical protein P8625_03140 [Tenacibaculum tangerinum]|uniref:DUF6896 domain-containing protein n=1 Tax=Tenacibaculum tangerinum TaxID=3038772 RepID=A0ABY8L419_9FLAO|nr:hypothetical protein [Tenacibaculum tangerinum]WGH76178.1 hypothetical protein P8625_03140 [Tenacibaculum tangerinum]
MTIEIKKPLRIEKIKTLLEKNERILFVLNNGSFNRDYIVKLQKELSSYVVSEINWINKLVIVPSISTKTVLENLNKFYQCIELFDKTAHSLMNLMAETFDIDLNNSSEIYDLKKNRSEKQRGQINDEWKYYFHGKGCSFTNIITEQFLDVQIINGLEFGELDAYYLLKFIQTTESLKEMSLILNDESNNMQKVIEILRINDYLIQLSDENTGRLIINRNKKPVDNTIYSK